MLYSILAKAFDLKNDFGISYQTRDPTGNDQWLVVLSDWDLDAAFLRAHNLSIVTAAEPCLTLKVEVKTGAEAPAWEVWQTTKQEGLNVMQQQLDLGQKFLLNHMEKALNIAQKAWNFVDEQTYLPPVPPLSDLDFRKYCDSVGQIIHGDQLRRIIYLGGIDSSLRRVLWKLLLNVYPERMTGKERMDYMKKKSNEYIQMRETWQTALQAGNTEGELGYVTGMVRKDVLRTDRLHPFYAGNDDNQNITALFNILTTYSLNHPSVSYCQGMSDFCSCILVSMQGDEAQSFICFCALMRRIQPNFMIDGIAMTQKFSHLAESLQHYDSEFFVYLKEQQADDLLFCYRWLLLEMKREFAFDEALLMLDVLWSSLPPDPPETELPLFEKLFEVTKSQPKQQIVTASGTVIRKPRENAYTKVCDMRRQSSNQSLLRFDVNNRIDQFNLSLDENTTIKEPLEFVKPSYSLDESKLQSKKNNEEDEIKRLSFNTNPFLENAGLLAVTGGYVEEPIINGSSSNGVLEAALRQIERERMGCTFPSKAKLVKNLSEFWNIYSYDQTPDKIGSKQDYKTQTTSSNHTDSDQEVRFTKNISDDDSGAATENKDFGPNNSQDKSMSSMTISITQNVKASMDHLVYQGMTQDNIASESSYNTFAHLGHNDTGIIVKSSTDYDIKTRVHSGIFIWENPLHSELDDSDGPLQLEDDKLIKAQLENNKEHILIDPTNPFFDHLTYTEQKIEEEQMTSSFEEAAEPEANKVHQGLPAPNEFGGGNPFLMFLALTLLLQHRDTIMRKYIFQTEFLLLKFRTL